MAGPEQYRERDENSSSGIFAGVLAALVGGVVWYLIVRFTGYEVGWVAWGVGFVVGAAMARATPARSKQLAVQAGLVAAAGLIIGKLLIVQWMAGPGLADELQKDSETLRQVVFWNMYENDQFPEDLAAQIVALPEDQPWPDSVQARVDKVLDARLATMSDEDRAEAATQLAGVLAADIGVFQGLVMSLSLYDVLWFFLAVGTAWKLLLPGPEPEPDGVAA